MGLQCTPRYIQEKHTFVRRCHSPIRATQGDYWWECCRPKRKQHLWRITTRCIAYKKGIFLHILQICMCILISALLVYPSFSLCSPHTRRICEVNGKHYTLHWRRLNCSLLTWSWLKNLWNPVEDLELLKRKYSESECAPREQGPVLRPKATSSAESALQLKWKYKWLSQEISWYELQYKEGDHD